MKRAAWSTLVVVALGEDHLRADLSQLLMQAVEPPKQQIYHADGRRGDEAKALKGKVAIANAHLFREIEEKSRLLEVANDLAAARPLFIGHDGVELGLGVGDLARPRAAEALTLF